jgi:hypothetical protein
MAAGSFIVRALDFFRAGWRQVVFAGHDFFAGPGFEFQAGAFANLRGGLVFGHSGGSSGLGYLVFGNSGGCIL